MKNKDSASDKSMSLIDFLANEAGCPYVSDLFYLNAGGKEKLVGVLKRIPPDAFSLKDWNDALAYLAKAPVQETVDAACELLIASLTAKQE